MAAAGGFLPHQWHTKHCVIPALGMGFQVLLTLLLLRLQSDLIFNGAAKQADDSLCATGSYPMPSLQRRPALVQRYGLPHAGTRV